MAEIEQMIQETARRHGFGVDAVGALYQALRSGWGRQAQFNHPELGGFGQWSGGMIQIGDMFNNALKARVAAACADLADLAGRPEPEAAAWGSHQSQSQGPGDGFSRLSGSGRSGWWPADLGQPASTGAQNQTRYACFPDRHRLAVDQGGIVTVYDTGEHRISGFSQQQSSGSLMGFTSQYGAVMIDALRVVG